MNDRISVQPPSAASNCENVRTSVQPSGISQAFLDNLYCLQARFPEVATINDQYMALAYTVRDRMLHRWINAAHTYLQKQSRTVCYLSAEFLIGPQLGKNLISLDIEQPVRQALEAMNIRLEDLLEQEEEPGLGNGGLGRLAACFFDSMATLGIPSFGYGIRYEFGIFDQEIRDGWQMEVTDKWLRLGCPWETPRPEIVFNVGFGGRTESRTEAGEFVVKWIPDRVVRGMAHDTPIVGYRVNNVNLLRLWKAEATESFDFQAFNHGDYYRAVMDKVVSENITKVLYPNDDSPQGKQLRLQQQYFFASCSIQDMLRLFFQKNKRLDQFDKKFAVQINDTHPAIAVAELMRLLIDEHSLGWERAWSITQRTFGYTNHTLLPEALEKWPVELFGSLLPRHLEIIYEINRRFLEEVRLRFPGDEARVSRLSLIDETGPRYVRMAHLACLGSHAINGVAELHTELLKKTVLRDFYELIPDKFANVTNGVTPRRFIALSNPRLAALISKAIGRGWIRHLDELAKLEPWAEQPDFRREWMAVKLANKRDLADFVERVLRVRVDPQSMFDVQVKRIHEYKRQHLNALHIIALYNRLRRNPTLPLPPRTFIFGGKAAPGYFMAKLIIKFVHCLAEIVNNDPVIGGRIKVAFIPDFNVKNAQRIYPAVDLSEQISTAGKEASGTGNMKMTLNGALTIGTLDGANVEIRERVGADNFFLFGLTASEVFELQSNHYRPRDCYEANAELKEVLDQVRSGFFSPGAPALFEPLVDVLLNYDPFMVLADFAGYLECQDRVAQSYLDPDKWTRMSILNVARSGFFSSDRSILEYCQRIWNVEPVHIAVPAENERTELPEFNNGVHTGK